MRKLFALVGAAALLALGTQAADAGHKIKKVVAKTYICWGSVEGHTDCAALPKRYFVPGVKRPTCCNVRGDTDRAEFILTRKRIAALAAQSIKTDTMAPGAAAGLQAVCKKVKVKR